MKILQSTPFDTDRKAHDWYAIWVNPVLVKYPTTRGKKEKSELVGMGDFVKTITGRYIDTPDWQGHIIGRSTEDDRRPMMRRIVEVMDSKLERSPYDSRGIAFYQDFGLLGPVGRLYVLQPGYRGLQPDSGRMIASLEALAGEIPGANIGLSWPRALDVTEEALDWCRNETVFGPESAVYLERDLISKEEADALWAAECEERGWPIEQFPSDALFDRWSIARDSFEWQLERTLIHYSNGGFPLK
jgi:hypothetical protein